MVNGLRPPFLPWLTPLRALLIRLLSRSHCRQPSLVAAGTRSSVPPPTPRSWSNQTHFLRLSTREPCVPHRSSVAVSLLGLPHTRRATDSQSEAKSSEPCPRSFSRGSLNYRRSRPAPRTGPAHAEAFVERDGFLCRPRPWFVSFS